jgi:hypothetical protein
MSKRSTYVPALTLNHHSANKDTTIIGNWIKNQRERQHIIFITANDEYFEELSK